MKLLTSTVLASLALALAACYSETKPEPAKTPTADAPAVEETIEEVPAEDSLGADSIEFAPAEDALGEEAIEEDAAADAAISKALVEKLNQDIAALEAKPEHTAPQVKVQHLLVSFKGAGVPNVQRSKEEAEALAAGLWKMIADGSDFDALIREFTHDSSPGIYTMVLSGTSGQVPGVGKVYARSGMVPAFGNVGWRLEVGEFGIAPWNAEQSPYGWHIIKRLE